MSIKQKSDEIADRAIQILQEGKFNGRIIAEVIELNQRSIDIYDEIIEICDNGQLDESVTVGIEGKKIKFKDIDQVAEFLTNGL